MDTITFSKRWPWLSGDLLDNCVDKYRDDEQAYELMDKLNDAFSQLAQIRGFLYSLRFDLETPGSRLSLKGPIKEESEDTFTNARNKTELIKVIEELLKTTNPKE